jgi:hypothetical protein
MFDYLYYCMYLAVNSLPTISLNSTERRMIQAQSLTKALLIETMFLSVFEAFKGIHMIWPEVPNVKPGIVLVIAVVLITISLSYLIFKNRDRTIVAAFQMKRGAYVIFDMIIGVLILLSPFYLLLAF